MSILSATFEASLLLGTFLCFSAWIYRYIFNHDIIVNSHRRTPKAEFNSVSARIGYRLLQLDTDGNESDQAIPTPSTPSYSNSFAAPFATSGMGGSGIGLGNFGGRDRCFSQDIVGLVFSLGIALSLELILVLMIQLFGSVEIGVHFIKIIIKLLVVLASTINPLMVIFLAINQQFSPKKPGPVDLSRYFMTMVACIAWYVALSRFGSIAQGLEENVGRRTHLERKTNEIALLGISITAILSGIGSASTPMRIFWTDSGKLAGFLGRAAPGAGISEAEVNEGIQSYNSTRMILNKRRAELRSILASPGRSFAGGGPDSDPSRRRGLFHRVQSFTTMGRGEAKDLEREIASLESLNEAIYAELCGKLERLAESKNGSRNRRLDAVVMLFNVVFSVYCIYRLVNVLVLRLPYHYWSKDMFTVSQTDIVKDSYHGSHTSPHQDPTKNSDDFNNITKDALAITIAKIIQSCFGYLPLSETQLINQVSFILSGSLFLCSFQNVLVTFTSVGRLLPASAMAETTKSWLKNLILSELLAIYVIATALLMRSNLPSESAESISHILSLISETGSFRDIMKEVQFIDAWFDKVFAVAGVVSLLILVLKSYIDNDTFDGYDEEAFIEDKMS